MNKLILLADGQRIIEHGNGKTSYLPPVSFPFVQPNSENKVETDLARVSILEAQGESHFMPNINFGKAD
jgi:hypothetical protein